MSERIFDKLEKIVTKLGGSTDGDKRIVNAIESIEEAKGGVKGDAKNIGMALDQLYDIIDVGENLFKYKATFKRTVTEFNDESVTVIPSNAFAGCRLLSSVAFQNCKTIDKYAFEMCTSLVNISFPACESIKTGAFAECSALSEASFPACTYIEGLAFNGCTNLPKLYFLGSTLISLYSPTAFSNTHPSLSIYVPESLYSSYLTATNWSAYASRIVSVSANE